MPSPDGRWIAFEERYRAFVAAFPHSGRPIEIGPSARHFPAASDFAGRRPLPALVGRQPHRALGARALSSSAAISRTRSRSSTALDEAASSPNRRAYTIGFTAATTCRTGPSRSSARGSSRWRATPDAGGAAAGVIEHGTVVVEGNRIVAVGPSGSGPRAGGRARVDVAGKTIIPGLVDVHAHVSGEDDGLLRRRPGRSSPTWPTA